MLDIPIPPPPTGPKKWWQTSYLWILICVNLGTIAAAATDLFPPNWVPFVSALSAGFYTVARGLVGLGKAMHVSPVTVVSETIQTETPAAEMGAPEHTIIEVKR